MHASKRSVKVEPCTYVHVAASFRVSFSIACFKKCRVLGGKLISMLASLTKYVLCSLSENSQKVLVFKPFL